MEIKNRLFPYPVLCVDNDDYVDSEFEASCKINQSMSDFILDFKISIQNNDEIKWLIREGLAECVVHIECSSTAYRVLRRPGAGDPIEYSMRIPKTRVNGEVAVLAAVVAAKTIKSFSSKHLNDDYEGEDINFERGAIIAYCNIPKINITKNYEELASESSFFTIIKRISTDGNDDNPVMFDITGPKIKIIVDAKVYDEYITYRNTPNLESISQSLLVMPAIIYMIETLRDGDMDNYQSLFWFQQIKKACKLRGEDFEQLVNDGDKTGVEIAQQLLQLPINRAYEGISRIWED